MDHNDLPLVVAEMLIDIQHLKARVGLLEDTLFEVRDDLGSIREGFGDITQNVRDMHDSLADQRNGLADVLARIRAVLQDRPRPDGAPGPGPADDSAADPANPPQ